MSDYRRMYLSGGTYFFTLVVHQRQPILTTELARHCLRESILETKSKFPFQIFAFVLMPDHFHTVCILPEKDTNYSIRLAKIKTGFTRKFLSQGGREGKVVPSRIKHGERGVWQRRFWEHTCRNEDDLKRCVDYIHWNPKKHKLVNRVADYPWSSFHRFVTLGEYDLDWGGTNPCPNWEQPE